MSNGDSEQTTSRVANQTNALDGTTITSCRHSNDKDPPKLRSKDGEEYEIWRKNIQWWSRLAKKPIARQAPHIIINSLHNTELKQIAQEISIEDAEREQGLGLLLQKIDKHFLPNTSFASLKCERTSATSEKQMTKAGFAMRRA